MTKPEHSTSEGLNADVFDPEAGDSDGIWDTELAPVAASTPKSQSFAPAADLGSADQTDPKSPTKPKKAGTGNAAPAKPQSTNGAKPSKAVVKKTVATVLRVAAGDAKDLALLSDLLGTDTTDVSSLAVAVLTASPDKASAARQTVKLSLTSPLSAGVFAATMAKAEQRAMWGLLTSLGLVSGTISSSEAKAAVTLAEAAISMDDDDRTRLETISTLIAGD